MRQEWLYFAKNRRTRLCLMILLFIFIVYTFLILLDIRSWVADRAAARMTFDFSINPEQDTFSALYFWYGLCPSFWVGNGYLASVSGMFMTLLLIPLLLGMAFVDTFVQDFHASVTDAMIAREGKLRYFANRFLLSFAGPFLTIFLLLIIQFFFGLLMMRVIPTGLQSPGIGMKEFGIVLYESLKMGFYYGTIMTFSYALSLVLKRRKTIVYIYPVIIVFLFEFLITPPILEMSFYYSNLLHADIRLFWGVLIAMLLVSAGLQLNALREKTLL